uniref:JAZF zinc finger 1 n=1 Tax=Podarcis muralis TaxID=64176 RepID=A0A670JQT6_PODMU
MTGIAAASFFSNTCRFGGCGLPFPTLAELIEHIEDNHIDTDPRVLEKQELQQPTYVALSYINRFMTDAARREQESLKKKIQPKLSLTLSSSVSRGNVSTPPRHSSGSLTPPVTPPITPSSSFRSSTPTGKRSWFRSIERLQCTIERFSSLACSHKEGHVVISVHSIFYWEINLMCITVRFCFANQNGLPDRCDWASVWFLYLIYLQWYLRLQTLQVTDSANPEIVPQVKNFASG